MIYGYLFTGISLFLATWGEKGVGRVLTRSVFVSKDRHDNTSWLLTTITQETNACA
jgi:hypothetical protein